MNDALRARLRAIAEEYLADARGCHRLDHTLRVVGNVLCLARSYPAVDVDVLEAATWLHDIGRSAEREGVSHAVISAESADRVLPELGFTPEQVHLAREAITDHRFSAGRVPSSLEGKLLQDADRLDALGAIGIVRTFVHGSMRELYHPEDPFAERRIPDDARYSLDHFFVKLFRLPETLHTPEAQGLAQRRVRYMQEFLAELAREIATGDSCGF